MNILAGRCGLCGACVAVCPHQLLEVDETGLKVHSECKNCGNCTIVCPLGALIMEKKDGI